ncbi:hypothetical protein [Roseibium suaedae]|uniref:CTP synthetase n=1 Tax=Roseibium suaedae TaxID=735517 RepID=A0A1M7GA12_9HYPH|nr:hypothetical protein [Roseibium suaedae]SHM12938.1 hypothetical protein SAMN05444272_1851 [Roseibium suaedae]
MWQLAAIFFIVIGPTLAGVGALIPLSIYGLNSFNPLLLAGCAIAGALLAVPVSLLVGKRISSMARARPV